jgi:amphi-Trp domain-containing protein
MNKTDRKDKMKMEAKGIVDRDTMLGYLEQIVHNLKSGNLSFEHGDSKFEFTAGDTIKFEIEAEKSDRKQELKLEFTWKEDYQDKGDFQLKVGPAHFQSSSETTHASDCECSCCVQPSGTIEYAPHHVPEVIEQAGCGVLPPHEKIKDAREVVFGEHKRVETHSLDSDAERDAAR